MGSPVTGLAKCTHTHRWALNVNGVFKKDYRSTQQALGPQAEEWTPMCMRRPECSHATVRVLGNKTKA